MSSRIAVIPASTKAGKEAIRVLLASDDTTIIRGIYRDPSKAPEEFAKHPQFEAVKGDVSNGADLDFTTSSAVFYIPPPTYDGADSATHGTATATNVAKALERAPSVRRLLLHSSLGAQYDHGTGVLMLNHITDEILKAAAPEVIIFRPCYYYENWAQALQTMQADSPSFDSIISPADYQIPMVSVKDVGEYCAKILLNQIKPGLGPVEVFGPRLYSPLDVKKAIETISGKKGELITVEKDALPEWWAKVVPESYVQEFVDFTTCQLAGGIAAGDYGYTDTTVRCETELIDGLRGML